MFWNKRNSKFSKLKKFSKDKRGFLLAEETLKVLVALIVLVFLVYFLYSLYSAKVNGDRVLQAQSLLIDSDESFQVIFNSLSDGGVYEKNVIEPSGWSFYSFSVGDVKPDTCNNKNCLCLCGSALDYKGRFDRQQKKCGDDGVCLIEEELGNFEKIKLDGELRTIIVTKTGGEIFLS